MSFLASSSSRALLRASLTVILVENLPIIEDIPLNIMIIIIFQLIIEKWKDDSFSKVLDLLNHKKLKLVTLFNNSNTIPYSLSLLFLPLFFTSLLISCYSINLYFFHKPKQSLRVSMHYIHNKCILIHLQFSFLQPIFQSIYQYMCGRALAFIYKQCWAYD